MRWCRYFFFFEKQRSQRQSSFKYTEQRENEKNLYLSSRLHQGFATRMNLLLFVLYIHDGEEIAVHLIFIQSPL